jgi:hypothetical protein
LSSPQPFPREADFHFGRMWSDWYVGFPFVFPAVDDYRPESGGCADWTEAEVREYYKDWTLKRDESCRPTWERDGN